MITVSVQPSPCDDNRRHLVLALLERYPDLGFVASPFITADMLQNLTEAQLLALRAEVVTLAASELLWSLPAAPVVTTVETESRVVATAVLNIRAAIGTNSEVIKQAKQGEWLTLEKPFITSGSDTWAKLAGEKAYAAVIYQGQTLLTPR